MRETTVGRLQCCFEPGATWEMSLFADFEHPIAGLRTINPAFAHRK